MTGLVFKEKDRDRCQGWGCALAADQSSALPAALARTNGFTRLSLAFLSVEWGLLVYKSKDGTQ